MQGTCKVTSQEEGNRPAENAIEQKKYEPKKVTESVEEAANESNGEEKQNQNDQLDSTSDQSQERDEEEIAERGNREENPTESEEVTENAKDGELQQMDLPPLDEGMQSYFTDVARGTTGEPV